MFGSRTVLAICLTLVLSACETPEETTTRLAQFNGKTMTEVISVIGEPTLQNKTTAVWFHESTHTEYRPIYRPYGYDRWYWHGHGYGYNYGYAHRYTYRLKCTYTATLKSGRVVSGTYKGNSCKRFAPKTKL